MSLPPSVLKISLYNYTLTSDCIIFPIKIKWNKKQGHSIYAGLARWIYYFSENRHKLHPVLKFPIEPGSSC